MEDIKWAALALIVVAVAVVIRGIRQISRDRANIERIEAERRASGGGWSGD